LTTFVAVEDGVAFDWRGVWGRMWVGNRMTDGVSDAALLGRRGVNGGGRGALIARA
jgi:hypothetical protein